MLEPVVGQTYRFKLGKDIAYRGWSDITITHVERGRIFASCQKGPFNDAHVNQLFFYTFDRFNRECEPIDRPEELINEDWS